MKKRNSKTVAENIVEEMVDTATVDQDDSQLAPIPEAAPEMDGTVNEDAPNPPVDDTTVDIQLPPPSEAPATTVEQDPPPTTKPIAAVQPESPSDPDTLDADVYRSLYFSRPLSSREAKQLKSDLEQRFDGYPIKAQRTVIRLENDTQVTVTMKGRRYGGFPGAPAWIIKRCSRITESGTDVEYSLDVIFGWYDSQWFYDNGTYNGDALKRLFEKYIGEAEKVSPLLKDLSAYELTQVRYELYFTANNIEDTAETALARYEHIYQPVEYTEWKTFLVDPLKKRGHSMLSKSSVKVDASRDCGMVIVNIDRSFDKNYRLIDLMKADSPPMRMMVEQILSRNYAYMSAATYAMATVMGGDYRSMKKATEIIESSGVNEKRKNSLLSTLTLVCDQKGVHNARLLFKDDRDKLVHFNNDLDMLAELGINPILIPEEYAVDELPNLIPDFYQRFGDLGKEGYHITIEDAAGTVPMPSQTKR